MERARRAALVASSGASGPGRHVTYARRRRAGTAAAAHGRRDPDGFRHVRADRSITRCSSRRCSHSVSSFHARAAGDQIEPSSLVTRTHGGNATEGSKRQQQRACSTPRYILIAVPLPPQPPRQQIPIGARAQISIACFRSRAPQRRDVAVTGHSVLMEEFREGGDSLAALAETAGVIPSGATSAG